MEAKHFKIFELVDRATYQQWGEDAWSLLHPDLIVMLDGIRDFFGLPVTVNNYHFGGLFQYRGYRGEACPIGAERSYHRRGMAADFDVKGFSAEEAREIIKVNQNSPLLAKIERMEQGVNWVHADLGTVPQGAGRIYLFNA